MTRWMLCAAAVAALAGCEPAAKQERTRDEVMPSVLPYKLVDELLGDDLASWSGKEMRVLGWVRAGTIREAVTAGQRSRAFVVAKGTKGLRVLTSASVPDAFREQAEVVVVGRVVPAAKLRAMAASLGISLDGEDYAFEANEVLAKCPSRYDGTPAAKAGPPRFQ